MANYRLRQTIIKTLSYAGAAVGGGALALKFFKTPDESLNKRSTFAIPSTSSTDSQLLPTVNASWTTNFTPSVSWDDDWDKRSPKSLTKPKRAVTDENNNEVDKVEVKQPMASRHLILIRHGQYYENAATDDKRILTSLGREQAEFTGARLKELGYPYTLLIHSTMSRAKETADIMLGHLDTLSVKSCDFLREGAPIPPEPPIGNWRPSRQFYQDGPRIEAAFRRYFYRASVSQTQDTYEILVCHANVIRYFVCRALQLPPEAWLRFSLHHGSITWMTIRPSGRVFVGALGDCGYMPSNKLSVR